MITFSHKDLFDVNASAYAQGVNTRGVMGAGIAPEFKKKYPSMFTEYQTLCNSDKLNLGDVFFYRSRKNKPHVLNLAVQENLSKAEISAMETCFDNILENYSYWGLKSIAMPTIGCGLGNLSWSGVRDLIYKKFEKSDLEIIICDNGQPLLPF